MKTNEFISGTVKHDSLTTKKKPMQDGSIGEYKQPMKKHADKEVNLLVVIAITVIVLLSFLLRYLLDA